MYEIEKGHPLDLRRPERHKALREAMAKLARAQVGDSIFVKEMRRDSLYARRKDWGLPKGVFSIRAVDGGVRVWKVAEPKD